MDKQQHFQPGDRVKVTIDLTVGDMCDWPPNGPSSLSDLWGLPRYPDQDHVTVELIERPEPPREPGWYLCAYGAARRALRWDGTNWLWPGSDLCVTSQDRVAVLGAVTLDEGVEL